MYVKTAITQWRPLIARADEYGGDEDFSWVMLEPVGGGGSSPAAETQSPAAGEA